MLVLLLKSTTLKTITVPGHWRDGQYIAPYQKQVHVDLDKTPDDVMEGMGSHSQKAALKELSKHDWFNKLHPSEAYYHVLSHATDKQIAASASAKLSTWKKNAMAGQNPTASEWKAVYALPLDKRKALLAAVEAKVGSLDHLKAPAVAASESAQASAIMAEPASAAKAPASVGDVFEFDSQFEKMNAGKWSVYNVSPDGALVYLHKVGAHEPGSSNTVSIPAETFKVAVEKGTAKLLNPPEVVSVADSGPGVAQVEAHPASAPDDVLDPLPASWQKVFDEVVSGSSDKKEKLQTLVDHPWPSIAAHAKKALADLEAKEAPENAAAAPAASAIPVKPHWWGKVKDDAKPIIEDAVGMAAAGKLQMLAYHTPVGWVREFGILQGDKIYTKPSAISMSGEVDASKPGWQAVSAEAALAYIGFGVAAKSGKWHAAGLSIYALVKRKDEVIAAAKEKAAALADPPKAVGVVEDAGEGWDKTADGQDVYADHPSEADDAPKDGDTKPGSDGMLVFKDGRWHKQDGEKALMAEVAKSAEEGDKIGLEVLAQEATHGYPKVAEYAQAALDKLLGKAPEPSAEAEHAAHQEWLSKMEANGAPSVDHDGHKWFVLSTGNDNPTGTAVWAHLASKTKGTLVKNGWYPDQTTTWIPKSMLQPPAASGWEVKPFKHTKTGVTKFAVPMAVKVDDATYDKLKAAATRLGGFYSKFKGPGAVPGFHFADEHVAEAFAETAAEIVPSKPAPKAVGVKDAPAAAPAPASAPAAAAAPAHSIDFAAHKLPDSNTNAKSVNKKVDAIEAAFKAGDAGALAAMSFGSNTYGKKLAKLRDAAYAVLAATAMSAKVAEPAVVAPVAPAAPAPEPEKPSPPAEKQTVFQDVFWNTQPGHSKFWAIHVDGTNVVTTWGKIGTKGKQTVKPFPTQEAAYKAAAKMQSEKKDKGYHWKGGKEIEVSAPAAPAAPSKPPIGIPGAVAKVELLPGFDTLSMPARVTLRQAAKAAESGDIETVEAKLAVLKNTSGAHMAFAVEQMLQTLKEQQAALATPEKAVSPAPHGPKDGDTKTENGKTYVLRGGKWHRVDKPTGAAPGALGHEQAEAIAFGHPNYANLKVAAKNDIALAAAYAANGQIDGLKNLKASISPKWKSALAIVTSLIDAVKASGGKASAAAKSPKASSQSPKAVGITTEVKPSDISDIGHWTSEGGQDGYNDGGFFKAPDGQRFYVKFTGEDVARSELLANALYAAAGINVPSMQLITRGGKVGTASKVIPGLKKDPAALKSGTAKAIYAGFAADVWLGNRDVVGNNPKGGWDNIQFVDGMPVRIDAGGALHYTGTGAKKGAGEFGDVPKELDGFFTKNPNAAKAFGGMTDADKALSAHALAHVSDATIDGLVAQFMGSGASADSLAATLKARRDYLLQKLAPGVKVSQGAAPSSPPKAKGVVIKKKSQLDAEKVEKPDPRHLKVNAANLIAPHDYMNWQGSGKPISDKPYVQQNIVDEKALYEAALKGDLVSFASYKYQPVDKMTGQPVGGPKPMSEHPSAHVKAFYSSLLDALNVIANPSAEHKAEWLPLETAGNGDLDEFFPAHKYGVTVSQVDADERLGFWMALGKIGNWQSWAPKAKPIKKLSGADKVAAHNYPSKLKKWLLDVKGSGSANQPYRDGKEFDVSKNFTREVIAEAYQYARKEDAGTEFYKWIDFNSDMLNDMMQADPGLVIQNPGSMCCSTHPTNTKGFGKHRLKIRYAEGAMALPNYGLGVYDGEDEITTIPGARFMLISKAPCADKSGAYDFELLLLPPDPAYITDAVNKTTAFKAGKDWKNA